MLSGGELVSLGRTLAQPIDAALRIEGIVSAEGGSGRAELLVSYATAGAEPTSMVINVDRTDTLAAARDLTEQLTVALAPLRSADQERRR